MNEKINNKLLAIPITFSFLVIALFCFFCIGLSKVDAASYKFNNPSLHRICEGDLVGSQSGQCITNNYNNEVWANDNPGYWLQVAYRANTNNNGQTGDTFIADTYSMAFSGFLHVSKNTIIDESAIRLKLLYYPTSDNQYGTATCDSGEIFRIQMIETATLKYFYYTYSCQTLNITSGKSYIGYEIYAPGFVGIGVTLPAITGNIIENNLVIGGPSDTQDLINNFNQNFNDLINSQNQNTDKITDAIEKSDETNQGILETITNFFSNFFEGLIGIFVPSNFDFLTGFLDTLENKLGFIASVPIQFLEFLANLVTIDFDTVSSVTLPHFEILGYTFIDEQEIDLSEIMAVFQPYRIYTNIGCVCLCIRYLMKLYENFANKE